MRDVESVFQRVTLGRMENQAFLLEPESRDDNGLIAGSYTLNQSSIGHGFVRQLVGRSISFDVAGDFGVEVPDINNTGLMPGYYYLSSDSEAHSFLARFVP